MQNFVVYPRISHGCYTCGISARIEVRISYFCPRIFHGYSTTCGSFRACRFATFEIVSCGTLSILHGFSMVVLSITPPLVVVLGRAGLQPLKLCHEELWLCRFSKDFPWLLNHLWYMGVHWSADFLLCRFSTDFPRLFCRSNPCGSLGHADLQPLKLSHESNM